MSEIGDAPLYNSCSLPIQVLTTGPLPALSKCKSGLPRITGMCPEWWKQSFRLRLWSLLWFQVRATSCHLTSSKLAWKSTSKCTWMWWRVWWSPLLESKWYSHQLKLKLVVSTWTIVITFYKWINQMAVLNNPP